MSLFSPYVGIVTRATPSGRSPVEELYFKWMIAAAVFFVVLQIAFLSMAGLPPIDKPWADDTNFAIGRDFLNTWMGGRSMFSGGPAPWFDARTYAAALRDMLGPTYPETYWSYPPHVVLFVWPLGLMPYLFAYIAWCVIGIALYLFACSSALPRERLLFLAVAPGVAVCVFFGQNGFYTAALLIGGLLALDRRPVLAGVLFGIPTIKPQLGLLLPIILLLERRWLTIAWAAATVAVLFVATAMLFGWDVWLDYWHKIVPQQMWLTENARGLMFSLVSSLFFAGTAAPSAFKRCLGDPIRRLCIRGRRGGVDLLEASRSGAVAFVVRHRDLLVHALYPQLRHGDVRLRGGAVARPRRQHHARSLAVARGLVAAGDDDVRRRDLDPAGAGRADRICVLAAAASGARRNKRSPALPEQTVLVSS